ncbi:hypothetical protein A2853_01325 [Candidatus Kaiserbacteria bacterium RIFCSPHIGHO2_01_FULL_55_17]|uniref:PKD domain-containing protein n=1 Tax=Candidatus Kaiserbacteria bacterium RIFCSPHIGHO2_01_FULL_55_17 TaxID=1798484 RepID=A0A1F6D9M4_9BACT|nr:MAG: hypothetical protein A2853_01325 [Candidatus Kaiserbacteria bacterium RIFCSPHIGHO2_01_FULL_55_17]
MYTRNFIIALAIVGVVASGVWFTPTTSAITIQELQAQIQILLARLAELQGSATVQIQNPTAASIVNPSGNIRHRICNMLARNLSQGARGDDVQSLQEFLRDEGYFSVNTTGYYGPVTAQALARWQASQGVQAAGVVGPITRERIRVWCGGGQGLGNDRFSASPQRGLAPLAVTFKTNVQLANSLFVADAGDYKVVFGDGAEEKFPCTGSTPWCFGPHMVTHTYMSNGTYAASLVHYGYFGPPGSSGIPEQTIATQTIYVGDAFCTKEYVPVCGQKSIVCITTPCNPIQQTYGNRCMMEADGASFLYEGACRASNTDPSADPRCRAWYDGCNNCSRETPNGPAACTLRACFQRAPAYCTAYFDANKPPAISGFSGPTTLNVNQTGTWAINASDPENGSLSYSINWGDAYAATPAYAAVDAFVQTSTFTHAYAYVGTYTVTIVVRDSMGQEARTTSTVRVGDQPVACTLEYNPVCGQPPEPACRYSIPACMMATPGPQTYSNRCMMNAAGATLLYEGQCRSGY